MARSRQAVFHSVTAAVTSVSPEARCRWLSNVRSRSSPRRLKKMARASALRESPARHGGRPFKMTAAKLCLAQAAIGRPETKAAELGIMRQTLYRQVTPKGEIRPDGGECDNPADSRPTKCNPSKPATLDPIPAASRQLYDREYKSSFEDAHRRTSRAVQRPDRHFRACRTSRNGRHSPRP